MYIFRNIHTIKQQTYFNLANKLGDNSMFVKVSLYKKSSYFVYDEVNKLDLLQMRVIGPYDYIIKILYNYAILVNCDWAVRDWQEKSNSLGIRNTGKCSKHLSTKYGGNNKNSGSSGNRNVLRWRRLRSIIIKRYFCNKKGVRNKFFNENKPSGILDLKGLKEFFLIPNNKVIENIMRFIKNVDILKIAYAKIINNTGISYGSYPNVNEDYFRELSKELGTGSYKCKPTKRIYIKKKKWEITTYKYTLF